MCYLIDVHISCGQSLPVTPAGPNILADACHLGLSPPEKYKPDASCLDGEEDGLLVCNPLQSPVACPRARCPLWLWGVGGLVHVLDFQDFLSEVGSETS